MAGTASKVSHTFPQELERRIIDEARAMDSVNIVHYTTVAHDFEEENSEHYLYPSFHIWRHQ
eukprot:25971-Eustigmatos_ZCMA.PRE.1